MIPHTLALKPGLIIHSVYNGYWFWRRLLPPTSGTTCVPSRATSGPTGTEDSRTPPAWDAGDFSSFHGWNTWPKAL